MRIAKNFTLTLFLFIGLFFISANTAYAAYFDGKYEGSGSGTCQSQHQGQTTWFSGEEQFEVLDNLLKDPERGEALIGEDGRAYIETSTTLEDGSTGPALYSYEFYTQEDEVVAVVMSAEAKPVYPGASLPSECTGEVRATRTSIPEPPCCLPPDDDSNWIDSVPGGLTTLLVAGVLAAVVITAVITATVMTHSSSAATHATEELDEGHSLGEHASVESQKKHVEEWTSDESVQEKTRHTKPKSKRKGRHWREVQSKKIVKPKPGQKAPGGKSLPPKYEPPSK